MHGEIDLTGTQRRLEFEGEKALAELARQHRRLIGVTARRDDAHGKVDRRSGPRRLRAQRRDRVLGLPERERAAARAADERFHAEFSGGDSVATIRSCAKRATALRIASERCRGRPESSSGSTFSKNDSRISTMSL